MKRHDYICTFNLDDCIKTLGLEERGRVQQVVTNEFKKNVEPYVPLDVAEKYENPGRLIDSGHIENETDVVWNAPYARRMYYHPEYEFQGAPMRGGYWADRYMQNGGRDEIEQAARKAVKEGRYHRQL